MLRPPKKNPSFPPRLALSGLIKYGIATVMMMPKRAWTAVATATVLERTLVALTSQNIAKATGPTLQLYTEFHIRSLEVSVQYREKGTLQTHNEDFAHVAPVVGTRSSIPTTNMSTVRIARPIPNRALLPNFCIRYHDKSTLTQPMAMKPMPILNA
jgi:hypothetical protein